jgi:hypothetical protein
MNTIRETLVIPGLVLLFIMLGAGCPRAPDSGGSTPADSGVDNSPADSGNGTGDEGNEPVNHDAAGMVADHTAADDFDALPASYVRAAQSALHIFYGHTSHGSQLVTGIDMIAAAASAYPSAAQLDLTEYDGDLGTQGDLSWVDATRTALDAPGNHINVVMWSWCGGVSDNTTSGIDAYLGALDQLEREYPDVTFVYMTGHLDGSGPAENLYRGNNQIRDYCSAHDKVLFDFADIESYDPAGTYYPDGSDACEWCATWCATHTCATCGECAHSHCFNCYRKGRTLWWLLGRLAGWSG